MKPLKLYLKILGHKFTIYFLRNTKNSSNEPEEQRHYFVELLYLCVDTDEHVGVGRVVA